MSRVRLVILRSLHSALLSVCSEHLLVAFQHTILIASSLKPYPAYPGSRDGAPGLGLADHCIPVPLPW